MKGRAETLILLLLLFELLFELSLKPTNGKCLLLVLHELLLSLFLFLGVLFHLSLQLSHCSNTY